MSTSFGEQLRAAREARGVSLREISDQTRISMRYLEAIESDDYKRLPGGIFNKSFVKAYARHIGFDEKEALEAYLRAAREQGGDEEMPVFYQQPRVYTDGNSTRSPLITLLLTILILGLLVLGVIAGRHGWQRYLAPQRNDAATQPGPAGNVTVPPAGSGQQSQNAGTAAANPGGPAPATQTGAGAPATAGPPIDVQVKAANEVVWIRAFVDDPAATHSAFAGNLNPGDVKEFKPDQRLELQFSKVRASGLQVFVNGRQLKVVPESKGTLASMVITRDNYQQLLQ